MLKKILAVVGKIILTVVVVVAGFFIYFNVPVAKINDNASLGITFSNRYAKDIGLNWQEAYVSILDELQAKKVRLPVYWDWVEAREGEYDFSEIDWQLEEARKRNVEVILTMGQKVPRWPECFIPSWANTSDEKRKSSLLKFIGVVVGRYKDNHPEIRYWQIENEPFLKFGVCPSIDPNLLDSEIAVAHLKDPSRKIIVTDSGELSLWVSAALRADIFGTTLYRTIWKEKIGYFDYPIGPRFFRFKKWLIHVFAHQDNAIVIELQGEPWISGWTTSGSLEEQFKSMNSEKLKENVEYAKQADFSEIYIWGAEWWYWLKVEKNHPEVWDTAKEMFAKHN